MSSTVYGQSQLSDIRVKTAPMSYRHLLVLAKKLNITVSKKDLKETYDVAKAQMPKIGMPYEYNISFVMSHVELSSSICKSIENQYKNDPQFLNPNTNIHSLDRVLLNRDLTSQEKTDVQEIARKDNLFVYCIVLLNSFESLTN